MGRLRTTAAAPPRRLHLRAVQQPPAASVRPRATELATPPLRPARPAAEAPRPPADAGEPAGRELAITWRPEPAPLAAAEPVAALAGCGWSRSCSACTGPESMLRFVYNSPRYRVMCCCSRRRRCRRPWCPGSSAALRGGSRGRGRESRVLGATRLRRPGTSGSSHRTPQVMPPPPASA